MNWYYESAGQQQGPVADSEIDRLLAQGKITQDTLVWREGMAGWTPLRTARPSAPPSMQDIDESDAGWEVTRPGIPLAGHPLPAQGSDSPQPGWIRCSLTGRYFPPSEIIYLEGKPYSAAAKPQVVASMQSGGMLPIGSGERNGPAWEMRDQLGLVKAMLDTAKAVLLTPAECFATMRREGGLGSPVLFLLLTSIIGAVFNGIYNVVFQGAMAGMMAQMNTGGQQMPAMAMFGGGVLGAVIGIVMFPATIVITTFMWAGIVHLALMMFKGANRPFETTMRVSCYTIGVGMLFYVIPMCGGLVGAVWGLVAMCIGLGKAHDTTTGKGAAATLVPFAVCCIGMIGLYATIIVAIMGAAGGAGVN